MFETWAKQLPWWAPAGLDPDDSYEPEDPSHQNAVADARLRNFFLDIYVCDTY